MDRNSAAPRAMASLQAWYEEEGSDNEEAQRSGHINQAAVPPKKR